MNTHGSPVGLAATEAEIFDRTRLAIDLDEATDPDAPLSALLMIGLPRPALGTITDPILRTAIEQLGNRIGELVGNRGSIYRMRATEICAIVEGGISDMREVLWALNGEFTHGPELAREVVVALVVMPEEATDALAALMLADRRMATHQGPSPTTQRCEESWAGSLPMCQRLETLRPPQRARG